VLCRTKADQVTLPFVIAENVVYTDPKVRIQFATSMHVVSASVNVEYRIAIVRTRGLIPPMFGPLLVSFATPASPEDTAKPSGGSDTKVTAISIDWLVTGLMANAYA